ncbi:MAG TPA: MDR family MFS transporter [Thermoanaerobaculia bacterium]|jgi:EmrB/QacA subfamily drug resistance transporter
MQALSKRRRWAVTIGVMTGMLLAALEATVVGTAMPTIVAVLGGLAHYSWVFSAYLLTSTVTVPLWGKLSDLFGRRLMFQIGVALFLVGSLACGVSQTMFQLIVSRAVQGLGAGALVPLAMTIIGDIYTLEERARMQGLFSGVWGVSSVLGPLLGGFITDQLSWRWVFFINLPVGIAAAAIIGFALVEPPRASKPVIDYAGAAVLMFAVTLLLLALGGESASGSAIGARQIGAAVVAFAMLALFVRIERRARDPIVPLELFRNRIVAIAIIVGFLAGIAMFGAISFIPLLAQGVFNASATAAGSFLTPLMLSWVAASIVGGRLLIRIGARPLVLGGLLLMLAGFAALCTFHATTPRAVMMAELAAIGAGLGTTMLTLLIAAQQSVDRQQLGITTSLNQFSRSIGGAIGVALLGTLMAAGLAANLQRAAARPNAPLTPQQAASLADDPSALVNAGARAAIGPAAVHVLQESLAAALRRVFTVCAAVVVLALIVSIRMLGARRERACQPDDGERFVMAEMTMLDARDEPES